MYIHWGRILLTELAFTFLVMCALGFVKMPRFLMRRRLSRRFPWGYYADQVPRVEAGYFQDNSRDFMYDIGTDFGGFEGFGDFGEFTGFGELGEFGNAPFADGGGGEGGAFGGE